jgi:putative hemolysin
MLVVEICILVVLIALNGLLAMSDAICSSRRARLRRMVDMNVNGSRRALLLASDPGKFLSTVQIGITLVGELSGAFFRGDYWPALGELADGFRNVRERCRTRLASVCVPKTSSALIS